jgi:hypothetical protein
MSQYTAGDMMKAYSEDAIELAGKMGEKLDFSEDSLKKVEDILEKYHNDIPKGFIKRMFKKCPTQEEIIQIAKVWGGYIGEVMHKSFGGEWTLEDLFGEKNLIVLTVGETKIFPVAKAYKRIVNGKEDDIYFYYEVIKKELKRK